MRAVIRLIGLAGGGPTLLDGRFVEDYDPAAHDGRGALKTTDDPQRALKFPDVGEAIAFWRAPAPPPHHLRLDGQPNRPLTAFTVEVIELDHIEGSNSTTEALA